MALVSFDHHPHPGSSGSLKRALENFLLRFLWVGPSLLTHPFLTQEGSAPTGIQMFLNITCLKSLWASLSLSVLFHFSSPHPQLQENFPKVQSRLMSPILASVVCSLVLTPLPLKSLSLTPVIFLSQIQWVLLWAHFIPSLDLLDSVDNAFSS